MAGERQSIRDDLECLALTVYFEARGEPDVGKLAVANVVLNRTLDARFPLGVCDVVWQGEPVAGDACQFSWACDGLSDRPGDIEAWRRSWAIARLAYFGRLRDPTNGALWYHADYVSPAWSTALAPAQTIGRHLFYGPKGSAQPAPTARSADEVRDAGLFAAAVQAISAVALSPGLRISALAYSADPAGRFVRINGSVFREGEVVAYGLKLETISPQGVVLHHTSRTIYLPL